MPVLPAVGGGVVRVWAVRALTGDPPPAALLALLLLAWTVVLPAPLLNGTLPTVPLPVDRGSSRLPGLESSLPRLVQIGTKLVLSWRAHWWTIISSHRTERTGEEWKQRDVFLM